MLEPAQDKGYATFTFINSNVSTRGAHVLKVGEQELALALIDDLNYTT